ncbi:hypothetical protein [Gephyromycinifex aptenodytis]|uniref:hypothetical protein n=1 Tax=Gephyromycinifex aptenodytis TaxID=2716227 RepID=UPI0014488F41|nr:hypothetical protein [Gephyromycinifex aptenodytis]
MAEHLIAVTLVGPDRKGLLADVTGALVPLAVYHGDPTFTMLPGGNVAILLAMRTDVDAAAVRHALAPLTNEPWIAVHVDDLADRASQAETQGARFVLRIRTQGRPGVLAEFTKIVAQHGGLLVDFGTRIGGDRISVLRVELQDPAEHNVDALTQALYSAAEQMGIGIKFYDTALGENPLM